MSDEFDAMRATVARDGGISESSILQFLERQPELRNSQLGVAIENAQTKAGVSAGHAFFRLSVQGDVGQKYRGSFVIRFDVGEHRLFRQGSLQDQFDVMAALHGRGLEVPDAVWFDPDGIVAPSSPALIMRRIEARGPHALRMPEMLYMEKGPFIDAPHKVRLQMVRNVMEFFKRVHSYVLEDLALPFLTRRGGEGHHFIDREINWMQAELHARYSHREEGERAPLLERIRQSCDIGASWLLERAPRDAAPVLVHGDATLANVVFDEAGSVLAVLDWELCHEGLAAEDVVWLPLAAKCAANFYKATVVAIPTLDEMAASYRSVGGEIEHFEFAAALSVFRMMCISALAFRGMPRGTWATQPELWKNLEDMFAEAKTNFDHA